MTENTLIAHVRHLAEQLNLLIFHCKDPRGSDPGLPDLILVGRAVLWRELKPEHGDLRFHQRRWLRRLRAARQNVDVWRPSDWESGRIQRELEVLAPPAPYKQLSLFEEKEAA